jgi:hypothetical protein
MKAWGRMVGSVGETLCCSFSRSILAKIGWDDPIVATVIQFASKIRHQHYVRRQGGIEVPII